MTQLDRACILVDRQSGRFRVVGLWESREAMAAAEPAVVRMREQGAQELGASVSPTIEEYEVATEV